MRCNPRRIWIHLSSVVKVESLFCEGTARFGFENPQAEIASAVQFRSLRNRHVLSITMPKSSAATKTPRAPSSSRKSARKEEEEEAAVAELALKAHVLISDPEILAEMTEGDRIMQGIGDMVDLTEAPEDAVCGLVIGLLQYCEREKIDWDQEIMLRARKHLRSESADEVQE